MVDIWLIFAQVIPFVEVLLHTWIDSLAEDENEHLQVYQKINLLIVNKAQISSFVLQNLYLRCLIFFLLTLKKGQRHLYIPCQ